MSIFTRQRDDYRAYAVTTPWAPKPVVICAWILLHAIQPLRKWSGYAPLRSFLMAALVHMSGFLFAAYAWCGIQVLAWQLNNAQADLAGETFSGIGETDHARFLRSLVERRQEKFDRFSHEMVNIALRWSTVPQVKGTGKEQ